MSRKIPIWSWRHAIMKSKASAAARHLCHVIACDLSDTGKFTRLTIDELSEATGMSARSISRHIADAEAAGLLRVERVHDASGHVCGTRYYPQFPDDMTLASEPAECLSDNLADRGKPARKAVRLSAKNDKPIGQIGCTDIDTFPSTLPIKKIRAQAHEARCGHTLDIEDAIAAAPPSDHHTSQTISDEQRRAFAARMKQLANSVRMNSPAKGNTDHGQRKSFHSRIQNGGWQADHAGQNGDRIRNAGERRSAQSDDHLPEKHVGETLSDCLQI